MRYLLHDVFLDSVKKNPNNIAIYFEGGREISYSDLNKLSNRFANITSSFKSDTRKQPFVGILSAVNINSIAAILGTLKIGCSYIPLDEYSPTERLMSIVNNTELDIIFMDPFWFDKHKELVRSVKKIIFLDETDIVADGIIGFEKILENESTEPVLLNQVSDDLAYILHSSGSTGVPKGIMLTHRNARTFVDWMQKEFKLTPSDVVMSRAPFKFDLSVFDIFNTFNVGAKLVCYDWNKEREDSLKHSDYVKLMQEQKASILYTTPSTFITLLNRGGLADAKLNLREIMYAGEPFPTAQLRKLQQALPKTRIANIYGPTETNIITYFWIDKIPENDSSVPLGYVVDDTEILVVSEDGERICEVDELGELWCRGGTVTLGYLGMEDKTRDSLVDSPFHKFPVKFWRTGDFGYRDKDGILFYRGRRDHMVKVKGYRIELGEIESALAKNDNLDEFCVVALPDEIYGSRLYCYYSVLKNRLISPVELKSFLLTKIPEYMVPFSFEMKDVLPKTSSGKVDRVLLLEDARSHKK